MNKKMIPEGFREKKVTVTINRVGVDPGRGISFHIKGGVYDAYARDYIVAITLDDEEGFNELMKAGMSEDEIMRLMDEAWSLKMKSLGVELDRPFKMRTTVLAHRRYA